MDIENESFTNQDDSNISDDESQDKEEESAIVEEEPKEVILDESTISICISMLCKTSDGMDFAYVLLYCVQKLLTNISILSRYAHLRYINLSNNKISDISSLGSLNDLISLDCSSNRITTIGNMDLPYLRSLNLSNNKISKMEIITFPQLETLNLNGNFISSLYTEDEQTSLRSELLPELINVELRGNRLVDTSGLENLTEIRNVYLSKNKITTICGLDNLIHLTSLHLRDNKLQLLDGFSDELQSLQYLNLRGNRVTTIEEMKKLSPLTLLRALVLSENPVSEMDEYRMETLTALRKLVRLDKDEFIDDERTEAEEIYKQRLQDEMMENEKPDLNDDENNNEE